MLRIPKFARFKLDSKKKIVDRRSLRKILTRLRKDGNTIAFTNGCFDILHFGHVSYLERAKKDNRVLIVGLNSDSSARKIKGRNRPIIPQKERAGVLAALSCVDYVTIFNEATPLKMIQALQPDILMKGADWKGKDVTGSQVVRSYGGRVEFIRYLKGFSTTKIIQAIAAKCLE